jgi:hypothetical protein
VEGPLTPSRFHKVREPAYRDLSGFREARGEAFRAVVGRFYPGVTDHTKRPVNLHQFLLTTLVPYLAPPSVAAMVRHTRQSLVFEAEVLQLVLNKHLQRIRFADLIGEAAIDMIFSPMAIWRSGLMTGPNALSVEDREIPLGTPFTARVDLDDYFCDPQARDRRELKFEGERFRTPRAMAIESGLYGRLPGDTEFPGLVCTPDEARAVLAALSPAHQRAGSEGSDRASEINRNRNEDDVLAEMVELCHVAFYDGDRTVVGVCPWEPAGAGGIDKWLSLETFEGDVRGPYNVESFYRLPNNYMGLSLEQAQRDIAMAIDECAVKLIEDIRSHKVVNTYRPDAAEDAMEIQEALNGTWVKVQDPTSIGAVTSGGPPPEATRNFSALMSLWSGITANLPLAAGVGDDSADTATAFAGLSGRLNVRLEYLTRAVMKLATAGLQHHAHYFTEYPVVKESVMYRVPGVGEVDWEYNSAVREGAYSDFVFEIEPFTIQPMDPALRSARALEGLGVYVQYLPLVAQGVIPGDVLARLLKQATGSDLFDQLNPQAALMNEAVYAGAGVNSPLGVQSRTIPGARGMGSSIFQGTAGSFGQGGIGMGGGMRRPSSARPVDQTLGAMAGGMAQ